MNTKKKLRIAMLGTRGVPANYGGFETCVEEVGARLAEYGHDVTVYCRKGFYKKRPRSYKGMKLVYLTHIRQRALETLSHTFLSVCHGLFQNFDIYMVFNAANSLLVMPLSLLGKKIIINTDGLEWKRSKWGKLGRGYYKISEKIACIAATRLISDSKGIQDYYKKIHKAKSTRIAYGAYPQCPKETNRLKELGLKPFDYFLQITRFEPENHPLLSIQAFKLLTTNKKLVLIGGNPYPNDYTKCLEEEAAGANVMLPGFIYDKSLLEQIWHFSYAYIHGNSVGGTNPALLQAMAAKCLVIAHENSFNRDVLKGCGKYYPATVKALLRRMQWAIDNPTLADELKDKAFYRVLNAYTWEKVAGQYQSLFYETLHR